MWSRNRFVLYLDKVERQDLSKNELSSLARILAGAGKTMQALELCKGVIMAGGQEASGASRLIFQAMEKDEKISAMQMQALFQEVKAVWSKDPRGRAALSRLESFLFSKMAQEGRAQDVLDIINERMTHVSADSDQSEWDTVRNYLHVYDALGKQEKGEKVTLHYAEKLRTIADKRKWIRLRMPQKNIFKKQNI